MHDDDDREPFLDRWVGPTLQRIVVNPLAERFFTAVGHFERETRKTMSALSDAVQSVADDQKRIGDDVKAVLALLTQPNPDVAAAVTALQAVDASLDSSAEALEAALPPATAPAEPAG